MIQRDKRDVMGINKVAMHERQLRTTVDESDCRDRAAIEVDIDGKAIGAFSCKSSNVVDREAKGGDRERETGDRDSGNRDRR
jgi:hypothetical protein